jgi:hypothetical protein
MAVLGIRALRLGSPTRKFSDERPVPKFKEKMNAGTISEWLSHNDHTQGRNRTVAVSLAFKEPGRWLATLQENHRARQRIPLEKQEAAGSVASPKDDH